MTTRFEIPLKNGRAIILTPAQISSGEIDKLIAYLESLKSAKE